MIEFETLGTARLLGHEGNEIHSILARPKLLGLLAYLAAARPPGFQRRDTIIGMFWPDVDQERARRSLRQSLYHLRASLGDSAIVSRGDEEVGLNEADFRCDVWALDAAFEKNDAETALGLYRGDFLEGFYLSGLREFEGWVDERRGVFREQAAASALELAEQSDDVAQAAAYARRATRLSPLDEGLMRRAILVLDRAGDRAGAARTYQEFADRLARELGVEPSPESQALIAEIRDRGPGDREERADTAGEGSHAPVERGASASRQESMAGPRSRISNFFLEIGRRNVTRVAVAYCVVALAVLEAADLIVPRLQLPDWSVTLLLIVLLLGFPIVLVLAWVFDVGPRGITRTPTSLATEPLSATPDFGARAKVAITAAAVALVVGAVAWRLFHDRRPVLDADRVLVAGLENQTGDTSLAPLGSVALDWLTRGLQQTGAIRVIDARLLAGDPLGFASAGPSGLTTALTVAREAGAGTLLSGAYYKQGDSVYFQVHLTDVVTGETRHSLDPVAGSLDTPLEGVEDLRQRVMSTLAALSRLGLQTIPVKPPTYDAYREFMAGLILAAQGDGAGATRHAFRAAALDTSFAAPLLLASGEMIGSGQFTRADSILTVVSRKRDRLSVLEETALDGQMARLRGDLVGYLAAARRNEEFFGPSLDQVNGLIWLNRPRDAIDVLGQLDTTDVLSGGRPDYWRLLHDAYHMVGDYERALAAGARARAKYPDSPSILLTDIPTLGALGRTEELDLRLSEAARVPWAGRGRALLADAMLTSAYELRAHGHRDASLAMIDRFLNWMATPTDETLGSAGDRLRVANALYLAGRWDEAEGKLDGRGRDGRYSIDVALLDGVIAAKRGDRDLALEISDELRDLEAPYLFGANTISRARIAAVLGEPERAVELIRDAFAEGLRFGIWLHRDIHFEPLRNLPAFQELIRPTG